MIEPALLDILQKEVRSRIDEDRKVLDEMRDEVRPLKSAMSTVIASAYSVSVAVAATPSTRP
jgi:hypothetical protein